MSDAPESLDDMVRRLDPDRWLSTRFITDDKARADVIALYALNVEARARYVSALISCENHR